MPEFDDERRLPPAYREALFQEFYFACAFCGHRGSARTLRVIMDIPEDQGGIDERENLLVACTGCAAEKDLQGKTGLEYEEWRTQYPLLANYGPA
ncbi:MAG: hypothetical protein NTZ05_11590 [Chloroflexi bacterium]|nr:hypothetical protein [Chloroflexota bacterium]